MLVLYYCFGFCLPVCIESEDSKLWGTPLIILVNYLAERVNVTKQCDVVLLFTYSYTRMEHLQTHTDRDRKQYSTEW